MFRKTTGQAWGTQAIDYYDPDYTLWLWHVSSNYYISALPGQPLSIDGTGAIYPQGFLYNGFDYYPDTYVTGGWLWRNLTTNRWTISNFLGYGTREYQVSPSTEWLGDLWWQSSTTSLLGTYVPRGWHKDLRANKTVANSTVIGWTRATNFNGVYDPVTGSGLTGQKYAGWLTYQNDTATHTFIDTGSTHNSKPLFAGWSGNYLWWDTASSRWIISMAAGTKSSTSGYWSNTSIAGSYTRVYTGPSPDPDSTVYNLSFKEYGATVGAVSQLMAQVALWI